MGIINILATAIVSIFIFIIFIFLVIRRALSNTVTGLNQQYKEEQDKLIESTKIIEPIDDPVYTLEITLNRINEIRNKKNYDKIFRLGQNPNMLNMNQKRIYYEQMKLHNIVIYIKQNHKNETEKVYKDISKQIIANNKLMKSNPEKIKELTENNMDLNYIKTKLDIIN